MKVLILALSVLSLACGNTKKEPSDTTLVVDTLQHNDTVPRDTVKCKTPKCPE